MRWILKKKQLPKKQLIDYSINRTEEVREIIDRMPTSFGKRVAIAVIVFASLFLLFGWIIKYPDSVPGNIKINSNNSPVKLVANSSGKLDILNFEARSSVKEGDYIAIIQNSTYTEDVVTIKKSLIGFIPHDSLFKYYLDILPKHVSLGDLNVKYYTFLNALENQCDYKITNTYEQQIKTLREDIKWKDLILKETYEMLETAKRKKKIAQKWEDKYKELNQKDVVHDFEYDKIINDFITVQQQVEAFNKELLSIKMQIEESNNRLQEIKIEKKKKEKQMYMELILSYQDFIDNIKVWEQRYVFIAPFSGKVEFLKFLTVNQYIHLGDEIFSILPEENLIYGQMYLPSSGAGKVSNGNRVIIKLDNYPYREFGAVEGKVRSISLISQPQKTEQQTINTYLVAVELPKGLITNYGEKLDFKYEIEGIADIIVKERRLIHRLFDNIRYNTK